jgi:hypothetical protein
MITGGSINIEGKNPQDTLASHQRAFNNISMSYHREANKVIVNCSDSLHMDANDCRAMRDFLSSIMLEIERREDLVKEVKNQ